MPINTPQPPPAATTALHAGLGRMRGVPPAGAMAEAAGAAGERLPHETYHLGLDSIEAKKGVAAAQQVGWRYLLGGVAAEVHARGGGYEFAGLNEGPFVQQMADVMESVRGEIGDDGYEPRFLRIPALYVAALWLKSTDDDLFVPLDPSNPELVARQVYSRQDFEAAIERAAEKMKAAVPPNKDQGPHAP